MPAALVGSGLHAAVPLPRPQGAHDLPDARALAIHQEVDAEELRGDPQAAEDGGNQRPPWSRAAACVRF